MILWWHMPLNGQALLSSGFLMLQSMLRWMLCFIVQLRTQGKVLEMFPKSSLPTKFDFLIIQISSVDSCYA